MFGAGVFGMRISPRRSEIQPRLDRPRARHERHRSRDHQWAITSTAPCSSAGKEFSPAHSPPANTAAAGRSSAACGDQGRVEQAQQVQHRGEDQWHPLTARNRFRRVLHHHGGRTLLSRLADVVVRHAAVVAGDPFSLVAQHRDVVVQPDERRRGRRCCARRRS